MQAHAGCFAGNSFQLLAIALLSLATLPRVSTAAQDPPSQTEAQKQPAAPATKPGQLPCVAASDADRFANKDVCISAHVYDVVQLADGTRFLDVCPENVPDDQCRFTVICPPTDREEVGDLGKYRNQEIRVRGIVRSMHGRLGIVLSHVRQFNGGPEKFRPNPRLVRGFNAQSDRMPVRDPNLRIAGHHRSFMNSRDTEPLPASRR